jgi:hypothetical protein
MGGTVILPRRGHKAENDGNWARNPVDREPARLEVALDFVAISCEESWSLPRAREIPFDAGNLVHAGRAAADTETWQNWTKTQALG